MALSLVLCSVVEAQSPIANRVKGVISSLPKSAKVVARYMDTQRHSLYFIIENRLYCYDVITEKRNEVSFADGSYNSILSIWLSPDRNFIFIAIDKKGFVSNYLDGGRELWRFDSLKKRYYKVGQGYKIRRLNDTIVIEQASRCINPQAPLDKQRWMGKEHYYDAYGKVIWAKEEFEIKK